MYWKINNKIDSQCYHRPRPENVNKYILKDTASLSDTKLNSEIFYIDKGTP